MVVASVGPVCERDGAVPRPEQVPVARATEDSEFGEVAALETLAASAPLGEEPANRAALPSPREAAPPVPPPVEGIESAEEDLVIPEGDDEDLDDLGLTPDEEFLFGESLRPEEPATAGAPFGEGSDFIRAPQETDRDFLIRIGRALAASGDRTAQAFANRIATDVLGVRRLP